jgi:hypothetical protein
MEYVVLHTDGDYQISNHMDFLQINSTDGHGFLEELLTYYIRKDEFLFYSRFHNSFPYNRSLFCILGDHNWLKY